MRSSRPPAGAGVVVLLVLLLVAACTSRSGGSGSVPVPPRPDGAGASTSAGPAATVAPFSSRPGTPPVTGLSSAAGSPGPGAATSRDTSPTPGSTPTGSPLPASTPVLFGATVDPTVVPALGVPAAEKLLGAKLRIINRFVAFSWRDGRETTILDQLRTESSATRTVMITWEPGDGTDDADPYPLASIASGAQDAYMVGFLQQLARFPGPVALRFGHEMNGSWYPWAGDPGQYVAAWRHLKSLRDIWSPAVRLVWSVNNVDVPADNRFELYWPGSGQVDVLGLDGYNCLRGWQTPEQVLDPAYGRLAALDPTAPIWITETASCEATAVPGAGAGSKADWIDDLLSPATHTRMPRLAAIVWFDRNKEFDWRINSSAASLTAFRRELAG